MLTVVLILVLLIALNALYVAAEFGAVAARRSRLKVLAGEGSALARMMLPVVSDTRNLDRYIAACQIGITFTSLMLGAFGQASLAPRLGPLFRQFGGFEKVASETASVVVILIVLTVLQMVIGELVPKSIALRYPTRTAMYTAYPLRWSMSLFSWFISFLNGSGILLLRLMRVPYKEGHGHIHTAEDIETMIGELGELKPGHETRLKRAMRLSARPARQLMIPRRHVSGIDAKTPLEEVLTILADSPYTRLPVYRGSMDDVVGILHTKDVVNHYARHGATGTVEDLQRTVLHVPESTTGDDLLDNFRENRTHQAMVVDEFGGVDGLVTLEDLVTDMLGELTDEFKSGDAQPELLPDGRYRVAGQLRLYEVEPLIGVHWDAESETIGGFVSERLGHIAEEGEILEVDGVTIQVEKVQERAIDSLLITPFDGEETGS